MAKYVQYAGFVSNLTDKLADVDTDLPVHDQHLSQLRSRLAKNGDYTFLKILDGTSVEYVRLSNNGGKLSLTRGLELTFPTTFPTGSCVKWELTPTAVRDIVCQTPCCPE